MATPARSLAGVSVQRDGRRAVARTLPEETPVALVYHGTTQAVMMATPADLEDFAVGFSLTEGFIARPGEISELELVEHERGIEARMWLANDNAAALEARRRRMAGAVGCGLCGVDSLEAAMRELPVVGGREVRLSAAEVAGATDSLQGRQPLQDQTRAVHAAGFLLPGEGVALAREDIGRHNALDKLVGALARVGIAPSRGAFVLTSRVSVEMVQKCAMAGAPALIAISAPTLRAVTLAEGAGITLAAFARGGGFDIYAHAYRILDGAADVA